MSNEQEKSNPLIYSEDEIQEFVESNGELGLLLSQFTKKGRTSGEDVFKQEKSLPEDNEAHLPSYVKRASEIRCKNCSDRGFYVVGGTMVKCTECITYDKVLGSGPEHTEIAGESIQIPKYYRDVENEFKKARLSEGKERDVLVHPSFDVYSQQLHKIYNRFKNGKLPNMSYFVAAPIGFGKNHFAYSCMRAALEANYKVAPYLDTEELLQLRISDPLAFKEIIQRPVLFLKVLVGYVDTEDMEMLRYIVEKRGRMELATIVISRYNLNYLSYLEPHLKALFVNREHRELYTKLVQVESPFLADYDAYKQARIERNNERYRLIENPTNDEQAHESYMRTSPPLPKRT